MKNDRTWLKAGSLAPWPIHSIEKPEPTAYDCEHTCAVADAILKKDNTLGGEWFKLENVSPGWAPGPSVYLEDHRSIALSTEKDAKSFEYRSLALAGDRDFFIVSQERNQEFEQYLRRDVGLGAPIVLALPQELILRTRRLAKAVQFCAPVMERLAAAANRFGGLNLIPFIPTGDVWALGRSIARRSGAPVRIAGSSPRLTACANDKLWFAGLVRNLFGLHALPLTERAFNLTQVSARLRALSKRSKQVIIKVPASAGSVGNMVFDSRALARHSLGGIRELILKKLHAVGWRREFPLLLGVWEERVVASPSVQLWIPLASTGAPIIEGLFMQALSAQTESFVGAEPANLGASTQCDLVRDAQRIALVLQRLGYFGRLSLDAVLVEDDQGCKSIRWIEANARWGGVSIPMTVAHRFHCDVMKDGILIGQHTCGNLKNLNVEGLVNRLQLEAPSFSRPRGALFLTPPQCGHLIFVIMGYAQEESRTLAENICSSVTASAGLSEINASRL